MDFFEMTNGQWTDLGISVLIVVAAVLLGRWVIAFLLDRILGRLAGRTRNTLDDAIIAAAKPPLYWLIVVIAFQFSLDRLTFLDEGLNARLDNVYFVLYLLIVFSLVWRLVTHLAVWYGQEIAPRTESDLDEQMVPFFRRVFLIIISIIAAIILLDRFNIDITALVTTLGIGSLAIALAAQESLADTISGFLIMIDRPFRIGDRIEIQDLNTWGDVVDIGLRSSRIRTRDNRMVIVPNSVISKSLIVNHAYPDTQYRIEIEVGVAYGTDLELARSTIIDAVRSVDGVLPERPVEALFLQFGDSALIFRVRWWLESYVDTRQMFDRVNTAMYKALQDAGIELPFPQQDVHHKIDAKDVEQISQVFAAGK